MSSIDFYLIGCALGLAGADEHSGDGPLVMQNSSYLKELSSIKWDTMITKEVLPKNQKLNTQIALQIICEQLAEKVSRFAKEKKSFAVIGGDHTSAIGTWSGVYDAYKDQGEIGLIWIDAHMDSHTPETTPSGHIHGMPLAILLGYGYEQLTHILHTNPKLKPENICLIGVRSFEEGEAQLLKKLNVKIYLMQEVKTRGFKVVLQEAIKIVKKNTVGFGVSIDIDAVDPLEAPGVDVPESDGIHTAELCGGLEMIANDPKLITTEIVEFDPLRDKNQMTEKLITSLLKIFIKGKYEQNN